jgi:hypothetical protein
VLAEHVTSFMFWYKVWTNNASPAQIPSHKPYAISAFNVWVSICGLHMLTGCCWVKLTPWFISLVQQNSFFTNHFEHISAELQAAMPVPAVMSPPYKCVLTPHSLLYTTLCHISLIGHAPTPQYGFICMVLRNQSMTSEDCIIRVICRIFFSIKWPCGLGLTFHFKHLVLQSCSHTAVIRERVRQNNAIMIPTTDPWSAPFHH